MSERFPSFDIPTIEPWWDLYMPAAFGEEAALIEALESVEVTVPLARRGDFYAIAARAFSLLGRRVESERLAQQAFQLGGDEAEALATFFRPDGQQCAERRMAPGRRPGLRADAGCDLAARYAIRGELDHARVAIARALEICPGHAEASRWARFLDTSEAPLAAVYLALDTRRQDATESPAAREAVDLLPVRRTGWVSLERYHRRVLGTPAPTAWAPAGTGRGRLQDVGITQTFFALDQEYDRLAAGHPLVALEIAADALRAKVDEQRDVLEEATRFWAEARQVDAEAANDAAQLLASLGTADARLARLGLEGVACLQAQRPESSDVWEGYRVWLEHLDGRPAAAARAAALAATRPIDAMTWRFAVEVLRAEKRDADLAAAVSSARGEPGLEGVLRAMYESPEAGKFRTVVGPRIAPRFQRTKKPKSARAGRAH